MLYWLYRMQADVVVGADNFDAPDDFEARRQAEAKTWNDGEDRIEVWDRSRLVAARDRRSA